MDVTIKFANKAAAEHFMSWLCNSGEQGYWCDMEIRESEDTTTPDMTATSFQYDFEDGLITTDCGRLDDE